jgi:hypothetical protein
MKSLFEIPTRFQVALNFSAISSQYACGSIPYSRAMRSIFCPCSSSPVRKKTFSLPYRAR